MWKYSEGVGKVTNDKMSDVLAFVLMLLLGIIGYAIIQNFFNEVGESAQTAPQPTSESEPTPLSATQ